MPDSRYARTIYLTAVCLLLGVIGVSYYTAWQLYSENREEFIVYLDDVTRQLALPYRLAQLEFEEEITALPVPVSGVSLASVADTWGDARSGSRTHEGTDIFAARGTPVFAVTEGYVVRAGTNELGGNIVFTVGPGGVRYYYAHLERIAEGIELGVRVTPDTVIGFVGSSGNAEGTSPHLHFGIYDGGPKNPYPFLVERE